MFMRIIFSIESNNQDKTVAQGRSYEWQKARSLPCFFISSAPGVVSSSTLPSAPEQMRPDGKQRDGNRI
jgi:hypothetical protein